MLDSVSLSDDENRPCQHKKEINMNRPGTIATDFSYTPNFGGTRLMHSIKTDFTLLYFYNPDCRDCQQVKQRIISSRLFSRLQMENRLKVLALYTDDDLAVWRDYRDQIPLGWINGHSRLTQGDKPLYTVRAIPSLYLLGRDKTVLLKDATFEQVEEELSARANPKPN